MPDTAFASLPLWPEALAALAAAGIEHPTPVQAAGIPQICAGEDTVMHSGTGTGKTLAYLLPVLHLLEANPTYRAAVFAPGAELAMQTYRIALDCKPGALPIAAAISTSNRKRQKKRVTKSTRLIIGTTDRLVTLFRGGKLKGVRVMVFDELDPILASKEAGFLGELLSRSEPVVQKIVASATLGKRSEAFLTRFFASVSRIVPEDNPLVNQIRHGRVNVGPRAKEVVLARFIDTHKCRPAIVFVSDPTQQRHLLRYLSAHGHRVASVGRDGSKQQRKEGLAAFREGRARVLLTTDAIARGLDVPEVPWVLHYDVPAVPESYVHRAGRTGRAGKEGWSVLFVDPASTGRVRHLERALGMSLPPFPR